MTRGSVITLIAACLFGLPGVVLAEPVATLLEKAVYTEETAGDLDKAIDLYQQIIRTTDADRPYLAQAQYRLGTCLLKKGSKDEAIAAFKKVVERFADQKEVAAQAAEQLRKLDYQPLEIQPAPWADGEVMRLRLTAMAGGEIGTIIYTADATEAGGKKLWVIRSHLLVTLSNTLQDTIVEAERDRFTPVTGRTLNSDMGDYRAVYEPNQVNLTTRTHGKESSRKVDVQQMVYDNEQALYLLRRLPLAEGYRASFMIFPVMGGSLAECRIEITGKEKVTVPAGTYECYKMNLSVWQGMTKGLEHQLWFSQDAHRYLVKYDSGSALMELAEVSKASVKPTAFGDPQLGISFSAPAGWFTYRHPGEQKGALIFQLLSPEPGPWALLAVGAGIKEFLGDMSAREVAGGDIEVLKGYFKGYAVRQASWKDLQVGGLPAARFEADYTDNGSAMVEYRTYILGSKGVYWFVFRVEKDQFDALRPTYDRMVDSFKVSSSASQPAAANAMGLLDGETRKKIEEFEKSFASWFQPESGYEAASQTEKDAMAERWIADARSDDITKRTRAIAALGNIRCAEAIDTLISIAEEPMSNNRPKWMAVRGLGRIGDKAAVPTLIELIDHGNLNVRVYSRLALAQITGQYLGDSKEKWRAWWKEHGQKAGPADKKAAEYLGGKGWQLWSKQKYPEAEATFGQATRTDPENANAWQGLGWSQFNQGKSMQAKDAFVKCLALQPDNAAALNGMGWIAKGQNMDDEAIGFWEKAVAASPEATAALRGLALTYMERKDYPKAIASFEKWLKAEPNNAEAQQGLKDAKAAGNGQPAAPAAAKTR